MQMIKRFLLSPKTIITLISAVVISGVLGSTIPQLTERPPRFFETWKANSPTVYYLIDLLQLNQVYTSVWFLVLVAFISLCLIFSIYYQQFKVLIKSRGPVKRDITESSFKDYITFELAHSLKSGFEGLSDRVQRIFKDRGYRPYLVSEESRYFIFGKNRIGRWGGIVFHVGLLVVIVAALYGLAFQKRGLIQMIQTDTFQGKDKDWVVKRLGIFARDFDLGFKVHLNNFTPSYWENDQIKELESSLTIINDKGGNKEFALSLRNPIKFKGTKIYQSTHYGYSLGFVLEREGGNPAITHFLLDASGKKDKPFVGKMDFPTTDYILEMKFYPNLIEPSFYATLPGVDLTVKEKGQKKFRGRVLFTQRAWLGKDTLTFAQIHYWTGLTFVKNYGMPLVYTGFALSTLGALLIFMLSYKEIHLKVIEDGDHIRLSMAGQAKRYKAIFSEEFKEIAERLEKVLT
jgi:cytochrome c biogenesis protein